MSRACAARRATQHFDAPRVGTDDVEDHAQRRSLAGAVAAEEAEYLALGDAEVEMVDGERVAEAFHDPVEDQAGGHSVTPTTLSSPLRSMYLL